MKILLINPPLSQPMGPYPAIGYLAGYLKTIGRTADLADASLDVLLRVFNAKGVRELADEIRRSSTPDDMRVTRFLSDVERYASTITTAVKCLQGQDHGAFARAARAGFFPEPLDAQAAWATQAFYNLQSVEARVGPVSTDQRQQLLTSDRPLRFAFGTAAETEEARYRASVVLADVASVIQLALEPDFELDTYAERLSDESASFDALAARLAAPPSWLDRHIDDVACGLAARHQPDVVGLSVPFAGTVYGALRLAQQFKRVNPSTTIVMGGGWVNTQLRALSDPRVFDLVDFVTLDDGERPLSCVLELREGRRRSNELCRTFVRRDGAVVFVNHPQERDVPWSQSGTPTYGGLPLKKYLAYRPTVQALQQFWGARWNKLTLAHGCYWNKCAFCDTGLDYVNRYEQVPIDVVIDRIKSEIAETGETGFHFVDEAMPPALMRKLAERLIDERLSIAWWGNARFDRALEDMGPLLARSGCVAITGGLETASQRTLALMEKGVPLEQGARVCAGLANCGIFVHAYLIYGFPTETAQETVDALEFVRQMFGVGALHSAMWHYFGLTQFSPMAQHPEKYGITIRPKLVDPFSNYLLEFDEVGRLDHESFGAGLRQAVGQYRFGVGLDRPAHSWFGGIATEMPPTTLAPDFVERATARVTR